MEAIIGEDNGGTGILLPELTADASRRAQAKAAEIGYSAEKHWPVAERCIQRLMLWAGVLIGDHAKRLEDRIGCHSSRVAAVAREFRRTCEAFIVEHIIASLGSISYDDDPYYLGLTLYRRGREKAVSPEELKAKADRLLAHMYDENTIEMDGDRRIVLKRQSNAASTSS